MEAVDAGVRGLRAVLNDEGARVRRSKEALVAAAAASRSSTALLNNVSADGEGADALRLRLALVRALLKCRKEQEAFKEAEATHKLHPKSKAAMCWFARCLFRRGRHKDGRKLLEQCLDDAEIV